MTNMMATPGEILLHCCCAPCATHCVEVLLRAGWEVTLQFSNSNIAPRAEYAARLAEAMRLAELHALELVVDPYDHGAWLGYVAGFEDEPERGRRCEMCFTFNLGRAAACAGRLGIPQFTTTLTVSRFKPSRTIFAVGERFERFVPIDFKKKDGFQRSLELSRDYGLYRQDYCGCEFSLRPRP